MIALHALLIGIDHYDPNEYCDSLEGAVADVEAMREYLWRVGVPPGQIQCLRSQPPSTEGLEPSGDRPTYEVMVKALQELTARARPGEQVLIHFSGHGGRTATLIPGSKGAEGVDEGFVPPDVGCSAARYLRDVELAYLIDAMVERRLLVTLVIDACHSGGMLRGRSGLVRRGRRQVDPTERSLDSLVASRRNLEKTWRRLAERTYSSARGGRTSQWLPGARGLILLAACRSVEAAYEVPLGGRARGLLTHSLLGILAEAGPEISWQEVYDRLVGRMHKYASFQTPVLEGETSRLVLGGELKILMGGFNVIEVADDGNRVRLGGGQALGLGKGALLRHFPSTAGPEFAGGAVVEIMEVGATDSWATALRSEVSQARILPGDRAVLIDPGERFRRRVAWLSGTTRGEAPSPLAAKLGGRSQRFLEPVQETESADFQVAITAAGEYEIWHGDGSPIPDVPRLPADREGSVFRVVDQLTHLASFYNVRDLENHDRSSPLCDAISLDLSLLPEDFELGQALDPRPFETGSIPEVKAGRWICLGVTNRSLQTLQIYILDLQPGWGIEQVHPTSGLETLEGGRKLHKPLEVYVPRAILGRCEILKVFATAEAPDFRRLALPQLGHAPARPRSALGIPESPLGRLFAEIAQNGPKARHVRTQYASRHWTSAQLEFEIVDGKGASGPGG